MSVILGRVTVFRLIMHVGETINDEPKFLASFRPQKMADSGTGTWGVRPSPGLRLK